MNNSDTIEGFQDYLNATDQSLTPEQMSAVSDALDTMKDRAKTFADILDKSHFLITNRPMELDEKSQNALDPVSRGILSELTPHLQNASWDRDTLEGIVQSLAEAHETKLGKLAAPLRAALSGRAVSPSVFDMMLLLGREETLARLTDVTKP